MKFLDRNGNVEVDDTIASRLNPLCDNDIERKTSDQNDTLETLRKICMRLSTTDTSLDNSEQCGQGFRTYLRSAPGVSEILPHLLLGGAAALRPGLIASLGVTCVINCTTELPDTPLPEGVAYLRVPLLDHDSSPLREYLHTVADAIEEVRRQGGRTLVHCVAGVSRSASLVLGYFVKHCGTTLAQAFHLTRTARPIIRPNSGFFLQLIQFEEEILGCASVRMVSNPILSNPIPDVYEADYRNTISFHKKYSKSILLHPLR